MKVASSETLKRPIGKVLPRVRSLLGVALIDCVGALDQNWMERDFKIERQDDRQLVRTLVRSESGVNRDSPITNRFDTAGSYRLLQRGTGRQIPSLLRTVQGSNSSNLRQVHCNSSWLSQVCRLLSRSAPIPDRLVRRMIRIDDPGVSARGRVVRLLSARPFSRVLGCAQFCGLVLSSRLSRQSKSNGRKEPPSSCSF